MVLTNTQSEAGIIIQLNDLYDVLDHLKLRRAMFLGNNYTFQSLDSFINGYLIAARSHQFNTSDFPDFSYFNTWLIGHLKKHFGESGGWHWQISNRNKNDDNAFKEFFHYLELFKKSKTSVRLMDLDTKTLSENSSTKPNESSKNNDRKFYQTSKNDKPTKIRWINMEHTNTVWIEILNDYNDIVTDSWFVSKKKAERSLRTDFGIFRNEWIENK